MPSGVVTQMRTPSGPRSSSSSSAASSYCLARPIRMSRNSGVSIGIEAAAAVSSSAFRIRSTTARSWENSSRTARESSSVRSRRTWSPIDPGPARNTRSLMVTTCSRAWRHRSRSCPASCAVGRRLSGGDATSAGRWARASCQLATLRHMEKSWPRTAEKVPAEDCARSPSQPEARIRSNWSGVTVIPSGDQIS